MTDDADDVTVVLVAAVAENGVIGADGGMPWHHPEDLRRFKETTTGHPVVMGRRTYESIVDRLGEPLPGRTSVVLSTRDLDLPGGAVLASSVEEALSLAREDCEERGVSTVYVAGGGSVYEQFLPPADRLVLTEVHASPEGDTRFPEWDREAWREVERDDRDELSFVTYERRD
jgi:dihydrofolate reductase